MPLTFSFKKTTQALNFFARQAGGSINKMKALKLIYFADRYHLRKFGRPITNDEYFAMKFGPVPSGAKDLLAEEDDYADEEAAYTHEYLAAGQDRYHYSSNQDVDSVVFSESDVEALTFAWETFGRHDQFVLAEITHQYPEWIKHQPAIEGGNTSRVKMNYSDFLEDSPSAPDPCFPLDEEDRELRREEIRELAEIHRLWN